MLESFENFKDANELNEGWDAIKKAGKASIAGKISGGIGSSATIDINIKATGKGKDVLKRAMDALAQEFED